MGYEGVKAAVAALNGADLGGKVIDTSVSVLTKSYAFMAEAPVSGVSAKLPIERVSENEHALCPRQNPMQRRTHMKRSEINKAIRELEAMCKKYNCYLPPFCDFYAGAVADQGT